MTIPLSQPTEKSVMLPPTPLPKLARVILHHRFRGGRGGGGGKDGRNKDPPPLQVLFAGGGGGWRGFHYRTFLPEGGSWKSVCRRGGWKSGVLIPPPPPPPGSDVHPPCRKVYVLSARSPPPPLPPWPYTGLTTTMHMTVSHIWMKPWIWSRIQATNISFGSWQIPR